MSPSEFSDLLESLVDQLAAIEHERWAHWQSYMHSKGLREPDGSLSIPANLVGRWERQFELNYDELSDEEKESDREQVRRYLPILKEAFSSRR